MDTPDPQTTNALCSACQEPLVCTQQVHYPDNGLVLPFDTFGYYGGFDDNLEVLTGRLRSREWILCHDCVVKFLDTFPLLSERVGPNCHPCRDEEPCCRHAYKPTDSFGKNDLAEGEATILTAWPDRKWKPHTPPEAHG
jgi:hypothetical protein